MGNLRRDFQIKPARLHGGVQSWIRWAALNSNYT
jgi:hypothetical protein